jgi:hypothetical protein
MLIRKTVQLFLLVTFITALAACSQSTAESETANNQASKMFYSMNSEGELIRPTDYRTWVYVGTPLTPNDMNNGKAAFQEFHNVYIDPVSYEHYQQKGTWREGTILIKELVSVGSKAAVSGSGYFMGDFIGLEATIKSAKEFPNEPGNWAYFSFTNHETGLLSETNKAFPSTSCNSCHNASAQDDFVFTQYYPILTAAKAYGSGVVESSPKRKAVPEKKP